MMWGFNIALAKPVTNPTDKPEQCVVQVDLICFETAKVCLNKEQPQSPPSTQDQTCGVTNEKAQRDSSTVKADNHRIVFQLTR